MIDVVQDGSGDQSQRLVVEASLRERTGKGYARKLRRAAKIPAVIIGGGKSVAIELNPKLLASVWRTDKRFILDLAGNQRPAVLKDVQVDAVKRTLLHADIMYS